MVGVVTTLVISRNKTCQHDLSEKKIKQPQIQGTVFIKMLT